jgi:hypothetical protein
VDAEHALELAHHARGDAGDGIHGGAALGHDAVDQPCTMSMPACIICAGQPSRI